MTNENQKVLLDIIGHTSLQEIKEHGFIILKKNEIDDLLNDYEDKRQLLGAIKEDLQRWVKAIP